MGTNYYAHHDTCESCKRPERTLHIGRSNIGWPFHFRVHQRHGDAEDFPKRMMHDSSDWRDLLNDTDIRIFDEYGKQNSVEEFWKMVDGKKRHRKKGVMSGGYLDENGYHFITREFG